MVKSIVLALTLIALSYAGSHPFSEFKEEESTIEKEEESTIEKEEESTIERIDINFYVSYFAGHEEKHYKIKKENGDYLDDFGKIIDSTFIQAFSNSFTDLYESNKFENGLLLFDHYPTFQILVIYPEREISLISKSSDPCYIPWNVMTNGLSYVQFSGKIPTTLFALLIEIDEDYWSPMEKKARFGCSSAPVPLEYAQKGPSPSFPQTLPLILPQEQRGNSHIKWNRGMDTPLKVFPLIQDDNVCCATQDHIFCINILTGEMKWNVYCENEIEDMWYSNSDYIKYWDKKLYISLKNRLICIESDLGDLLWEIKGDQLGGSPVLQNGRMYIIMQLTKEEPSDDQEILQLLCVNAQTGEILWEYTFLKPGTDYLVEKIHIDGDQVYVNSGEPALYCMDACTGDVVWDYKGFNISEIVLLKTNIILTNSSQGIITCLDKKTGSLQWKKSDLSKIYEINLINDDFIMVSVFTLMGISEILLNVETGEILWEGQIYGHGQKDIFDKNILYFFTQTKKTVGALQINTGEELWKYDFENEINGIYVSEEGILVADTLPEEDTQSFKISTLYFFDREGNIKWEYQYGPHRSCRGIKTYVHDSMLFISTYEGIIDAFDYHSGTLLWSIELRGNMIFELLFHNGNIYCSCDDGRIYCISEEAGDIRWIVNTESGFMIRSAFFPIYMEIHGELLLVGIENGSLFLISLE